MSRTDRATRILPGWRLVCPACGLTAEPGLFPRGCEYCLEAGRVEALLVEYDAGVASSRGAAVQGIWRSPALLPSPGPGYCKSLGEGNTPLVRIPELCELAQCDNLWLKLESHNPTVSHKDRFHAVSVAVAAALGYEGVVSWSTGNHGLAMSCYAAAHGLRAVVVGSARMPPLIQKAIRFAGGLPLLAEDDVTGKALTTLVDTGWFPCSTTWPMPVANPYGIEGYKTIAYEIRDQMDGRIPDATFVPTAGGDLLSGIWRGYRELAVGRNAPDSQVVAVQPSGAAPLVHALNEGLDEVVLLPEASSRALSIADPISGTIALRSLRESAGTAVAVSDQMIMDTGRMLAGHGMIVEPSSAASVAGALALFEQENERRKQTNVCVVTSSGLKWLDDYSEEPMPGGEVVTSVREALLKVDDYTLPT